MRLGHTPPFIMLDFEVLVNSHAYVRPEPIADADVEYPLIPPAPQVSLVNAKWRKQRWYLAKKLEDENRDSTQRIRRRFRVQAHAVDGINGCNDDTRLHRDEPGHFGRRPLEETFVRLLRHTHDFTSPPYLPLH